MLIIYKLYNNLTLNLLGIQGAKYHQFKIETKYIMIIKYYKLFEKLIQY